MSKTIELVVPDEVAGTPIEKDYLETIQQVLKEQAVLRLYREHKISTGRGAKMMGMSIYDFIQFLSAHQISIFNYAEGELEADLAAALAAVESASEPGKKKA
jgi:predicted HTH domain antitoxin